MILREKEVCGALSDQINRFLYVEATSKEIPAVQLLPTGLVYYTVVLGEPGKFCRNADCVTLPKHFIGGPITKPGIQIRTIDNYIHFGIEFHPWSLHESLGLDLEKAENSFLRPDQEVFKSIKSIVTSEVFDFESICKKLEQLMEKSLKPQQTDISRAIRLIAEKRGEITVDKLAEKSGFSERHFRRIFKKSFGISPKVYASVVQLNAALSVLKKYDDSLNLDFAFEGGYYDESHFIKRFKELVGCSPAEFLENPDEFLETYLLKNNS